MTKGNELYYEYRKKLNKENNTRKVYKREDDQGSGTRNERYINDVLGGEGQAVSAQPAPPVAPAKTRESLLSEYRSALGQRMSAQSPQQTLMNIAESRVQFDQQQDARRRQTNSGPMRSAQPTNPEQKLPGSPYIGTENSLGRYGKGNIDLYNRPQYRNPDGSVSTVRSISIGTDDGEVLIPTVGRDANGRPRLLSDDEAIDEYFRTGNNLGTFKTIEEADAYADRLHKQQEAYYTGKGQKLPSLEQLANPMRYAETRAAIANSNNRSIGNQTPEEVAEITRRARTKELLTPNKNNPVVSGFVQGTGIPSVVTAGEQAYAKLTGNNQMADESRQVYEREAAQNRLNQERHPIASTAGNIAGGIALLSAIGGAVGSLPGFGKLSGVARSIASGAASMGASTAVQEAGALATGMRSGKDFAEDVITSGLAGAAGGAASYKIGEAGANFLRSHGLGRNTLAQAVVAGLSGSAYSAGSTGVREAEAYINNPDEYQFDGPRVIKDAAVAFAFGALNYLGRAKLYGDNFTMNEDDTSQRPRSDWFDDCNTPEEVDRKLRQYARQYHPDMTGGDASVMSEINAAATNLKRWMNVNAGAQAYQKAQEAYTAGNAEEYQAATREYKAAVNALMVDVQSGAVSGQEAVEAIQILQSVSDNLAGDVSSPPAVVAPGADTSGPVNPMVPAGPDQAPSIPQQQIPGNPYVRTGSQQMADEAARIRALQYAQGQYPSVEEVNNELNSPFAVFENESPEAAGLQERNGQRLLMQLAEERAEQEAAVDMVSTSAAPTGQEVKRQAQTEPAVSPVSDVGQPSAPTENILMNLATERAQTDSTTLARQRNDVYQAGYQQNPNFQSVLDRATMLTEEEKTALFRQGGQDAVNAVRMEAQNGGESGTYLPGQGSGRALSLGGGEQAEGVSRTAGRAPEGWKNWTAAADAGIKGDAGESVALKSGVAAEKILRTAEPGQVIYEVESGHTPSMRKAAAMVSAYDSNIEIVPFVSEHDILVSEGEAVRAFIDPMTRRIGYRANDERATGEQLGKHELIEVGIIDGKIDIPEALSYLTSELKSLGVGELVDRIATAYMNGEASPSLEAIQHANKEMLCDIGAGINQFEGVKGYEILSDAVKIAHDRLHDFMNEKLGGAFDAEAEDVPAATMEGVTPEQAKALETVNTAIDTESGSANALPIEYSADLWNESQYVKERAKAVETICENLDVPQEKAEKYIDDINSVAKLIVSDRGRYDYKNSGLSPFVSNVEYGGSFDFDTLCPKRGPFIGTFQAIQEQLPNTALTRDEVLAIRKMMDDNGLEVPCGKCYVEGSRAAMGEFTKKFLELYKKYYPQNWQPNMAQANTPDGIEWIRLTHPECYEQYEYFWNHYGTLKPGDPNLFASQQKPKLYMSHSAYSNEILREFKNKLTVIEKNRNGGIRFQSFSDCEIIHIIDAMQAIMDMSVVGLNGQGYTKQPNFAAAFGDTGLKINLSIDAWGFDEDGKLIFNSKEGMPFETAMELRNKHSKNVGTICCVYDDKMLLAALADDRIDFIIPFHRSQWKKSQYKAMGLPSTTKDYTYQQNEKWLDPSKHTHEYRGRQVKTKCLNYMPNDYWDFSKSGKENAEKYLDMCYRDGKRPKFYKFLDKTMVDGKAKFSLKKDGSTDGYWKLLIDFKMYDNDGVGSPQMPVRPNFDMQEIQRMFDEYAGDHHSYPVANGIVDRFVSDYKKKHPGIQYSSKLNLSGKPGASRQRDSSGNELTVQQEEYFKDSKIRDEDGNLRVVYHGTYEDFNVFDKNKGRSNMDIQGSFFSPLDIDAEGYGPNVKTVYLNIKNPAPERVAYKALNMFKGQNGAGIKAREYLISRGYDGVNNSDEEYIAFYPEQIKNIDNLAPTENEDIRYSSKLDLREKQERDKEYMDAVNAGDMTRATQMVTRAAAEAGFTDAIPEQTLAYKVRTGKAPTKTKKVYKVFTVAPDGAPTALFVSGTQKLPQGVWLDAQDTWHFEAKNGKFYVPSTQNPYTEGGKTGTTVEIPNEEIRKELIERGFLPEGSKAKSVTALAYRPGWHAGDLPFFPQGGKQDKEYAAASSKAKADKEVFSGTEEHPYLNYHRYNQVVFECEMAFDKDYTRSHIGNEKGKASYGKVVYEDMQEMPVDGGYKFATNPMANANDIGSWFISGSLKIGRALSQEECDAILKENGRFPQLWEQGKLDLESLGYTGPQKDAARKTLAPVTYDDDGNVIPLSARFDPDIDDVRYSTKLKLQGKTVELTEREEKLVEQLSNSYLTRIEQVVAQKDAEIAELKEKMEAAVGAEKEKARQRIEKLRQEKNNRIAYLEKSYRKNLDWRIAEMRQKMDRAIGEEKAQAKERLDALRAQKNQKIEEILQAHREQRLKAREKRNERKIRMELLKKAQKAVRLAKNRPGYAAQAVQDLLKDIDLTALGMADSTKWNLRKKYQEILELRQTDENYAALHADKDMKKVERLFKKQIKDMDINEVNDLITELSALIHYQETSTKLLRDGQNRDAAEVGRKWVRDLEALPKLNIANGIKQMTHSYLRDNLSPERVARMISGYRRGSAAEELFRNLEDGLTQQKKFEQRVDQDLVQPFLAKKENQKFIEEAHKQTIPVRDRYGRKALISPGMRVALYMHRQNSDNLLHISTDGMTVPDAKLYEHGKIRDAYGRGETLILQPTEIDEVLKGMTQPEKDYAELLKKFFDTYAKDAINETSVDLDGILKAVVDDYFPISSNPDYLAKSLDLTQDPTLEGWNNLKARQEGASNTILLEDATRVLQRHIGNTARYYGMAVPLRNFQKVFGYTSSRQEDMSRRSVQKALHDAWDDSTVEWITQFIKDLNTGGRQYEKGLYEVVRSGYAGSTLTINAGVALKQFSSYTMAGSILDSESLMYGLAHGFTEKDQKYMDSITPWGWARRQGQSTVELGDLARKPNPITKRVPNWNQAMDVFTTNRLFLATERSVQKEFPDLKRGDKKYDSTLAERYNQVLWRTQPQYESMFRPEYLRKTDIMSRTFGMFKTESMQMSGEVIDAWGQWKADEKRAAKGDDLDRKMRDESAKQFFRTIASWVSSNLLFAIMGTAINILAYHKGKPYRNERGEIDLETLLKKTGLNFLGSSLGGFFFASTAYDFGNYLYNAIAGNKATWYDIEAPGLSLINDSINSMGNWVGTIRNEEASPDAKRKATLKFGLAVSKFTPVGFAENIMKLMDSVNLYVQDIQEGTFGAYEAGGGFLQDTSPTKEQYARRAVYYAGEDDFDKVEKALQNTNKANLEKALGVKITENLFKRFQEDPENLSKYLTAMGQENYKPRLSDVPDHGFSSFTQLREALGDPEREQNWHHIVEQEQGPGPKNFGTFKSTQVNNMNNIVSIPSGTKSPHSAISQYYGSVQDFTNGKTVREWLKDKSFEEQFEFGMEQLQKYGDVVPTGKGWVFVPDKEKIEELIPMTAGKNVEKTDTQKRWEFKLAEAREDGNLTDREIRDTALTMMTEGLSADEALELYKSKKKKDEKLDQWGGDFTDYLKSRNAIDEAKQIKDKDQKKRAVENYLRTYHGNREDELLLWKLAGYSENTFEYH